MKTDLVNLAGSLEKSCVMSENSCFVTRFYKKCESNLNGSNNE